MENEKVINEFWLSGEVPIYFVMFKEVIVTEQRSIMLTNFGTEGRLSNFTDEDLKKCEKESFELPGELPPEMQKMFCQTGADCACGVDKETGKCAFGNKNYIDTLRQCPDFCTGIAGHLRIKCVDNICTPFPIK